MAARIPHQSPDPQNLQPAERSSIIGNGQESGNNLDQKVEPTQSCSLKITKMTAMSNHDSSDLGSAAYADLVNVNGYEVIKESASSLRRIFTKYGDIAKGSTMQSARLRSTCLEMVCDIFQKLEGTKLKDITSVELKSMLDRDIQLERLEVGWLHRRLDEINDVQLVLKGFATLKEEMTRNQYKIVKIEKELDGYKAEMVLLEEKISLTQKELAGEKSESQSIGQRAWDMKTELKTFCQRSLVDGLL